MANKYLYILTDGSNITVGPFKTRGDAEAYRQSGPEPDKWRVYFMVRPPNGWKRDLTRAGVAERTVWAEAECPTK